MIAVAHAFDGAVVEVDVGDLDVGGEAGGIDGEAVVLAGDGDLAGAEVFDGLGAAAVAEFEFEGFAAEGVAEDLVAEADGEDGGFAHELVDFLVDVTERGGISGAVGEEDAVGIAGEDVGGFGGGGHDVDVEAILAEAAEDVLFDAEVVGDDAVFGGGELAEDAFGAAEGVLGGVGDVPLAAFGVFGVPSVGFGGGDFLDEVGTFHGRAGEGGGVGFGQGELAGDDATHGAGGAEVLGEGSGVDALDAGDVPVFEVLVEGAGGAPIAGDGAEFFDDEAADVGLVAFGIEIIDPVIPDHGVGHGDDLAAVGGIGSDLLVACH